LPEAATGVSEPAMSRLTAQTMTATTRRPQDVASPLLGFEFMSYTFTSVAR
jgi:hypothetical protein